MSNATLNIGSVTMPAGTYYVGDPCYSVPDERWMEYLEAARFDQPEGRRYLLAHLDGHPVLGIGTAYGDGEYPGSDGKYYPVDAGLIGLVPVEVGIEDPFGVNTVTFDEPFECSYKDKGTIVLGHIKIETGDWNEDD